MMNNSQQTAPQRLISELLSEFRSSGRCLREPIAKLAEMAASDDAETAEPATGAFFAALVEPLADSFDPAAVALYNRVFAQVIEVCRATERGRALDRELSGFGLSSEEELIARAESLRLRSASSHPLDGQSRMRRVILLSRVTLGADVAITSVMLERMKREFPKAEIAFVGGRKAAELFGGDKRLSFKEIDYGRAATLIERLLSWIDLLVVIRQLTAGLGRGDFLIVDPDTRLTQLGLLPLTANDEEYLFFPSRERGFGTKEPLGRLTSAWLDEAFGSEQPIYPRLSLARRDLDLANNLAKRARRPIVAINFGVGENPAKRVGDEFETALVSELISEGAAVILDRGAGDEETRRADAVISAARQSCGARAIEFSENDLANLASRAVVDADLIVWNGRIGLLAALISESDLYIGYDSAGQHIAAALGVPSIDVFAGFASARMLDRWTPTGTAPSRVIVASEPRDADAMALVADVIAAAREMLDIREPKSKGAQKAKSPQRAKRPQKAPDQD
jgi:ADP-heptose:LPS heptosyltransferase